MDLEVGFCATPGGARIAHGKLGQGPVMVMPPTYFAIISGYKYTFPETRAMFDNLARHHTVVFYGMRGAGLSERKRTVFTLESELQDLETVINHLKLGKMILYGTGQDYPRLLGQDIRDSKAFMLLVSDSADNSDSERKETTIAHNSKKPIIPVRIKDILPGNLEYRIANSLFFDAFPQPLEQYLPRLASDIKKVIGGKADKKSKG